MQTCKNSKPNEPLKDENDINDNKNEFRFKSYFIYRKNLHNKKKYIVNSKHFSIYILYMAFDVTLSFFLSLCIYLCII